MNNSKKISTQDATPFTIVGGTEGVLYPHHPTGEQSIARVTLDGRYPEKGYSINTVCTETLCVIEGSLTLTYGEETYTLESGDIFFVLPGTSYALEGRGESLVFITPQWDSDQNSMIDSPVTT